MWRPRSCRGLAWLLPSVACLLWLSFAKEEACSEDRFAPFKEAFAQSEEAAEACDRRACSTYCGPRGEEEKAESEFAKEEAEAEGEGEEAEEEEEEHDPVDVTIALMLMGGILFIFCIFNAVHLEDPDMVFYSWSMISSTISIFVAVLSFQCIEKFLHEGILETQGPLTHFLANIALLIGLYLFMQVLVAYESGMLRPDAVFDPERTKVVKGKRVKMSIPEQDEARFRRMKGSGILLSHMTGFAAIRAGGGAQHNIWNESEAPGLLRVGPGGAQHNIWNESEAPGLFRVLSVVPLIFAMQVGIAFASRKGRLQYLELLSDDFKESKAPAESSDRPRLKPSKSNIEQALAPAEDESAEIKKLRVFMANEWDEHTFECEMDITALSTSFLLVQACRYAISGSMPTSEGVDEEWMQSSESVTKLLVLGIIFALLTGLSVKLEDKLNEMERPSLKRLCKHVMSTLSGTVAMCFAWCLLFSARWQLPRVLPQLGNPEEPKAMMMQCFGLSICSFMFVMVLDKIADLEFTGEVTDKAIIRVISALGFLVGFAWEQAFHGGAHVLASCTGNPLLMYFVFALSVVALVLMPWRTIILQQLISLGEEHEEKRAHHGDFVPPRKSRRNSTSMASEGRTTSRDIVVFKEHYMPLPEQHEEGHALRED